jgi:dTDP-4-dehydrorhamnose reductase
MKALVTGAGGMLGRSLVAALRSAGHETLGLSHADADVTLPGALRAPMEAFRPDWVFHLAAFTRVDDCETRAEHAHQVNGQGARNVAQAAAGVGAAVLAVSSDYVFPGEASRPYREDDPTGPRSVYGASKLAGEVAVREVHPRHLIVRTAWLYGHGGTNFIDSILARARRGEPLRVVDDQRGSPTATADLAPALVKLACSGQYGTFHCTNAGDCTWHDLATHALARAGLPATVARIGSAELGRPARRPAYSVLSNLAFERVTGHRMAPWQDAVDRYLDAGAVAHRTAEEA